MENTHVRFGDLKPGRTFQYQDRVETFMVIKPVLTISKKSKNCVSLGTGELGYLEANIAVLLPLPVKGGDK